MNEHEKLQRATRQVEAMMGFYIHLAVYILVIAGLVAVNAYGGARWWAQWPALGWGLGLLGHAWGVFGRKPRFFVDWQLRKIRKLKEQM